MEKRRVKYYGNMKVPSLMESYVKLLYLFNINTELPQYLFEEGWGKVGVIACSQVNARLLQRAHNYVLNDDDYASLDELLLYP